MKLSEYYNNYKKPTLIVILNSQKARIIKAEDRDFNEVNVLEREEDKVEGRPGLGPNAGPLDEDAREKEGVKRFFKEVAEYLRGDISKEAGQILIAVPDIHSNLFESQLHNEIKDKMGEIINKNLASLELDAIARILQEVR